MKKLAIVLVIGMSFLFIQSAAFAQKSEPSTSESAGIDQEVQLLRSDIRSAKKQIIAENMKLTDAQAEKFWPVYDAYTHETTELGDASYALVKEYAQNYWDMTDAQADSLIDKMAALDVQTATLRQEWIPKFRKVLTGKQNALFFQLDRRINLLLDLQFAANIPLVK
ncbi:MAG: Spy/CpxP family protein refolding chaperone [Candidatus Korobacteraceae bacterium]